MKFAPPESGAQPSVKLPARDAALDVARLRSFARFGEKAALFAAADALVGPQTLEQKFRGGHLQSGVVFGVHAQSRDVIKKAGDFPQFGQMLAGFSGGCEFQFIAAFEPLHNRLQIGVAEILCKGFANGRANQFARDGLGAAQLAFILQLEFSSHRGNRAVNVGDTRNRCFFGVAHGALFGAADRIFEAGNRQALADAGAAVDAFVFAGLKGDFFDYFANVLRNFNVAAVAMRPGFLRGDSNSFADGRGVVGANFRADAIFERRDDFAARGVILGVRGEDEQHVERQADRVTFYLNVALLHDVEQADLNFSSEIGQFVDGENAAIGAREQAIVNGEFVGEIVPALCGANGIHVADHVGDGHVGSGEFFDITAAAREPANGQRFAFGLGAFAAGVANGAIRIVVDLAAGDDGDFRVEEIHQIAQDARLGLPAKSKQNKIVARENGVDDLRNHRVVIAANSREKFLAGAQFVQQVIAKLVFHAALSDARLAPAAFSQFAKQVWFGCHLFGAFC